ncbi:hypothetical protein [Methanobacterium petrolearium]|uniref:hypothetical protein n=1 Tax=Methanobacterium petrolearium TaxID=710190 RepID=UPI001AE8D4C6|nr:chemotaxis regulatin CheY-phosphate phosphatase CheZ [Methanobacterium petrolearium]BDZ71115.1 hypothetical protein GCM10025861_16320 [Methanobacterium petrolearium]
MDLTKKEIEELQEKLIIVYRFVSQQKKLKKFFYDGIEVEYNLLDDKGFLNKLIELDDSEELLKSCIIELEDMKGVGKSLNNREFQEFMMKQDWNSLYEKYNMKTMDDVNKLDLKMLMEIL